MFINLEEGLKAKLKAPTADGAISIIARKTLQETSNSSVPISLNNIAKKLSVSTKINNKLNQDALLYIADGRYRIEFSNSRNWKRQRFTIAHELMHVIIYDLLHDLVRFDKVDIKELERLCDLGASELLMPSKKLHSELEDEQISFNQLIKLSDKFKVSFTALCRKINYLQPENSFFIWRNYSRKVGEKKAYRVHKAFQTYTSKLEFPYIPIGCTAKHLSNSSIFGGELKIRKGKIKVKISKEIEYDFYLEPIKYNRDHDIFRSNQREDTNFLMILKKINK